MKRVFVVASFLISSCLANADEINTAAEAFNAGKAFSASAQKAAGDTVNAATGSAHLPNYRSDAPESANFQNGRNPIGTVGVGKQSQCNNHKSANGFEQQECDAVNFLSQHSTTRPKFHLDKKNDPILSGSKQILNNPGAAPTSTQHCRVEKLKTPATHTAETCTESQTTEIIPCDESFVGCTITSRKLECRPVRTTCVAGSDPCCTVEIICPSSGAMIRHSDCCGYRYAKTIYNVAEFRHGVSYNTAGARITCDTSGACSMSFESYYCANPSRSIRSYPNANTFKLSTSPIFSCLAGGGCETLEARTQ